MGKLMCVIIRKECDDIYWKDSIGGYHNPPVGWNPHGIYCGECNRITCEGCVAKDETEERF